MFTGENYSDIKKQIRLIATIVIIAIIFLVGGGVYYFREDFTPIIIKKFGVSKHVIEEFLKDEKVNAMREKIKNAKDEAFKYAENARNHAENARKYAEKTLEIKKTIKSQLKDVDTAYFKKYVFYKRKGKNNTTATVNKALDTGIHFFADETQQVSIRCWCDVQHTPCKNTAFKVFLDQLNIFDGYPYYGTPTGKDLSIKEEHYLPASFFSRTEEEKGEQRKKKVIKVTTANIAGPPDGARIELFCWVYVRHKGVLCEKTLVVR